MSQQPYLRRASHFCISTSFQLSCLSAILEILNYMDYFTWRAISWSISRVLTTYTMVMTYLLHFFVANLHLATPHWWKEVNVGNSHHHFTVIHSCAVCYNHCARPTCMVTPIHRAHLSRYCGYNHPNIQMPDCGGNTGHCQNVGPYLESCGKYYWSFLDRTNKIIAL